MSVEIVVAVVDFAVAYPVMVVPGHDSSHWWELLSSSWLTVYSTLVLCLHLTLHSLDDYRNQE